MIKNIRMKMGITFTISMYSLALVLSLEPNGYFLITINPLISAKKKQNTSDKNRIRTIMPTMLDKEKISLLKNPSLFVPSIIAKITQRSIAIMPIIKLTFSGLTGLFFFLLLFSMFNPIKDNFNFFFG